VVAYKRNGFDIWNFGSISRFDVSSVSLGKGDFIAGEIKNKRKCGIEFVLGTLIVSVIYFG
jgi:hypothetical protein